MKTNPNFNTNAPPFEVRGCKVILGGAFWGKGVQIGFRGCNTRLSHKNYALDICVKIRIPVRWNFCFFARYH